jgi:hypothetical protein
MSIPGKEDAMQEKIRKLELLEGLLCGDKERRRKEEEGKDEEGEREAARL